MRRVDRRWMRTLTFARRVATVQVYSLDKVGEREPLEEEAGITRSVWRFVDTGTHVKT